MTATSSSMPRLFSFWGGNQGPWAVLKSEVLIGDPLPEATHVGVGPGAVQPADSSWVLRGVTSNERYAERAEKTSLVSRQAGLGRPGSHLAALIPIRKSAAWWALAQDERRAIFEAQSHHIGIGMRYLPAIARRLHHCRDLDPNAPFDFLTWFEYAPGDAAAFDELLVALRTSPEWAFVDREVDWRLVRV